MTSPRERWKCQNQESRSSTQRPLPGTLVHDPPASGYRLISSSIHYSKQQADEYHLLLQRSFDGIERKFMSPKEGRSWPWPMCTVIVRRTMYPRTGVDTGNGCRLSRYDIMGGGGCGYGETPPRKHSQNKDANTNNFDDMASLESVYG